MYSQSSSLPPGGVYVFLFLWLLIEQLECSKSPHVRTYNFEMSLLVFLYSEVVLVTRALVHISGSNTNARKMIFDCVAFKYYVNILNPVDQNICMNLPQLMYQCIIIEGPMKRVDVQQD